MQTQIGIWVSVYSEGFGAQGQLVGRAVHGRERGVEDVGFVTPVWREEEIRPAPECRTDFLGMQERCYGIKVS